MAGSGRSQLTVPSDADTFLKAMGAKSWEDLCRMQSEAAQAGLRLGVLSFTTMRRLMIQERVGKAKDKDREIRKLAKEYGMSQGTVKVYAYSR